MSPAYMPRGFSDVVDRSALLIDLWRHLDGSWPSWVKSTDLTLCRRLPVCHDQRTSSDRPGWSVSSHALQQLRPYSMTSSAWTSSVCGTSIPCDLAVLRLMTNSNLVGW